MLNTSCRADFLVVLVTPIAFDTIGYYTCTSLSVFSSAHHRSQSWGDPLTDAVFAVINAIMVPTVYLFFPETAGRVRRPFPSFPLILF